MLGVAGAVGVNALILAMLLTLHGSVAGPEGRTPARTTIVTAELDPPPPPASPEEEGAAGTPSRGDTGEPSPAEPALPLAQPTPAEPALDAGPGPAAGVGSEAGTAAGTGGSGAGSGSGAGGTGRGAGAFTPPVHVAGALTHADYRRTRPPRGAGGTVRIAFRVSARGRVEDCRVEESSGWRVLDEATCRLVTERFRFDPARDASGRAIDWHLRTEFTWVPR